MKFFKHLQCFSALASVISYGFEKMLSQKSNTYSARMREDRGDEFLTLERVLHNDRGQDGIPIILCATPTVTTGVAIQSISPIQNSESKFLTSNTKISSIISSSSNSTYPFSRSPSELSLNENSQSPIINDLQIDDGAWDLDSNIKMKIPNYWQKTYAKSPSSDHQNSYLNKNPPAQNPNYRGR